jgi:hypothetical protein
MLVLTARGRWPITLLHWAKQRYIFRNWLHEPSCATRASPNTCMVVEIPRCSGRFTQILSSEPVAPPPHLLIGRPCNIDSFSSRRRLSDPSAEGMETHDCSRNPAFLLDYLRLGSLTPGDLNKIIRAQNCHKGLLIASPKAQTDWVGQNGLLRRFVCSFYVCKEYWTCNKLSAESQR